MICPFCRQSDLPNQPGSIICPACQTEMEIDDRGECVFANPDVLKMPLRGQICMECGLIQQDERFSCASCGTGINKMVH